MSYTKEQLWEQYQDIPEKIQELLFSVDHAEAIEKIGEKHHLHLDQLDILSQEIGLILLGLERPENFLTKIRTEINIPIEVAGEIVKDVNTEIFFPIRESLREIDEKRRKEEGITGAYTQEKAPRVEPINDNLTATPAKPQPSNIGQAVFEQKMGNLFHIEKEHKEVAPAIATTADQNQASKNPSSDPYREAF